MKAFGANGWADEGDSPHPMGNMPPGKRAHEGGSKARITDWEKGFGGVNERTAENYALSISRWRKYPDKRLEVGKIAH
jgi:hypothetical protein